MGVRLGQTVSIRAVSAYDEQKTLWVKTGEVTACGNYGRFKVTSETGAVFEFREGQAETVESGRGGKHVRILVEHESDSATAWAALDSLRESVCNAVYELEQLQGVIADCREGKVSFSVVSRRRELVKQLLENL